MMLVKYSNAWELHSEGKIMTMQIRQQREIPENEK